MLWPLRRRSVVRDALYVVLLIGPAPPKPRAPAGRPVGTGGPRREVASIVARLLVVLGLLGAAFGLLGAIVSVLAYGQGRRWAWYCLWLVPVTYAAISARMLADEYPIGYFYAGLAVAAAAALLIPIRRRPSRPRGHRDRPRAPQRCRRARDRLVRHGATIARRG